MKLVMRYEDVMNSLGYTVAIRTLRVVDDIGETLVAHRFNPKSKLTSEYLIEVFTGCIEKLNAYEEERRDAGWYT
jgi:hypothetical protein